MKNSIFSMFSNSNLFKKLMNEHFYVAQSRTGKNNGGQVDFFRYFSAGKAEFSP